MATKTTNMTLSEILIHLKELSDNGMSESDQFYQAHDLYIETLDSVNNATEIKKCTNFLNENSQSVGWLNTFYMIEQLEEKLEKS